MTDQQKKAVAEAAQAFVKEHASTIPFGQDSAVKADFMAGAEAVISNPEKYGLLPACIHENLASKYKGLVAFYDKHVGTPCEEIRHREEVERLKEENARLRSALVKISEFHDPLGMAQEALKGGEQA